MGGFCKKELFLSKQYMNYYPEPYSHYRDKFKVVLDLSNWATKKESQHATSIDRSDLPAKTRFYFFES